MPDKTDEPKPKVMRTVQIPPYDFKARFHHLEGVHRKLKSAYEAIQSSFTIYKDEQNEFKTQHEQMKDQLKQLEDSNLRAETEIATLQTKNTLIENANANFLKEVHESNCLAIDLKSQLSSKEESLRNLQTDLQLIKRDYKLSSEQIVHLKETNRSINAENDSKELKIEQLENKIAELIEEVDQKDLIRQNLHNDIQDLKGNIRVSCRVRPQMSNEVKMMATIKCSDETEIEIRRFTESVSAITGKFAEVKQEFSFDRVFGENR